MLTHFDIEYGWDYFSYTPSCDMNSGGYITGSQTPGTVVDVGLNCDAYYTVELVFDSDSSVTDPGFNITYGMVCAIEGCLDVDWNEDGSCTECHPDYQNIGGVCCESYQNI